MGPSVTIRMGSTLMIPLKTFGCFFDMLLPYLSGISLAALPSMIRCML